MKTAICQHDHLIRGANGLPCVPGSGLFPANCAHEAGVRSLRAFLQDSEEESQQVPILSLPEVPVVGNVP